MQVVDDSEILMLPTMLGRNHIGSWLKLQNSETEDISCRFSTLVEEGGSHCVTMDVSDGVNEMETLPTSSPVPFSPPEDPMLVLGLAEPAFYHIRSCLATFTFGMCANSFRLKIICLSYSTHSDRLFSTQFDTIRSSRSPGRRVGYNGISLYW